MEISSVSIQQLHLQHDDSQKYPELNQLVVLGGCLAGYVGGHEQEDQSICNYT